VKWRDAGIAVLAFAACTGVLAADGLGAAAPQAHPLDVTGVVGAAVATLPLALRRSNPLSVFVITATACSILVALGYPVDFPFGPLVAVYSIATGSHRRAGLVGTAVFFVAVTASYLARGFEVRASVPGLLFWALALSAAWLAGDRARQHRMYARLATAQERMRIARDLHDSAGHAINVILVQAGAARLLQDKDPAATAKAIATIEDVARETMGEFDRLVQTLRDEPGDLHELFERHAVEAAISGTPRAVTWTVYRILQEALTNAARHGTGGASVTVDYGQSAVDIEVTNPAADAVMGVGHGIIGMQERVSMLGGTFTAGPSNGGFRLHVRIPYA
jgi:signal transduction histidine kinase